MTNTDRSPQTLQRSQKPLRTIRFAVVSGCAEFQHCPDPPQKAPSQQPPHVVWARHHCTHLKITTLTSSVPYQCGTSGSDLLLMEIGRCFNQTFFINELVGASSSISLTTLRSIRGLLRWDCFHLQVFTAPRSGQSGTARCTHSRLNYSSTTAATIYVASHQRV